MSGADDKPLHVISYVSVSTVKSNFTVTRVNDFSDGPRTTAMTPLENLTPVYHRASGGAKARYTSKDTSRIVSLAAPSGTPSEKTTT